MGDQNPNSPSPLGQEIRYYQAREIPYPTNVVNLAMRIRPGATTITNMHVRLPTVKGAPGIVAEIVSDLAPAQTVSYFYPGSDTGDTTTGMQDNAAGALNFGDIDDPYQTAIYAQNTAALARTATALKAYFRGNNAGALAGRRILRVRVGATVMNRYTVGTAVSGNDPKVPITGQVVMGGNTYVGTQRFVPKVDAFQRYTDLCNWPLSPNTGIPWTVTEVDHIIDAANADTMGVNIFGKLDAAGLRIPAIWVEVTHVLENRLGFYYARGALRSGWDRYTLVSTSAESANTEYYACLGTLTGSQLDLFSAAFVNATQTSDIPSTGPTDTTHDHRQGVGIALTSPGGVGRDSTTQSIATDNEHMQVLFEAAGPTILGESQPYGRLETKDVYSGSTANVGQQITSPGAGLPASYVACQFTVGWQDQTTSPDRPLQVQVRHGAGAISGGGTLDMTGILDPAFMPDGTFRDYIVYFDGSFVPAINTQYVVLFSTTAVNGRGYRFLKQDTRNDDIVAGSGTTSANVLAASQGGSTDSYVEAGAQNTRYDLGVMLISAPAAPAPFVATAIPATTADGGAQSTNPNCVGSTYPPYVRLTWTATVLGSSFGSYNIYRRRRAIPVQPWVLIGQIKVPTLGPTAAQVETNWTEYRDYEATWAVPGSTAADGWDYALTVYNTSSNLESILGSKVALGVQPPASSDDWMTSNMEPWLCWPLRTQSGVNSSTMAQPKTYPQVAGRDFNLVRVQGTVPGRSYRLHWAFQDPDRGYSDEWPELRGPRAASRRGRQVAVQRIRGDRNLGVLSEPTTSQSSTVGTVAEADLFVTSNESPLTGANMPAGLVFDGAANYVSTPTTGLLDSVDGALTMFAVGVFANAAATRWALARANAGTGYGLQTTGAANVLSAYLNGTAGSGNVASTDATWFNGQVHVAVLTSTGTAQVFYLDGTVSAAGAVNHGAIAGNNLSLNFAARSDATAKMALAPGQAWGMYRRVLTVAEVRSLTRYLLGHALQTVPVGPQVFYDLRDKRCWDGASTNVYDLSGNGLTAATVAAPVPRGTPWPLADLDLGR